MNLDFPSAAAYTGPMRAARFAVIGVLAAAAAGGVALRVLRDRGGGPDRAEPAAVAPPAAGLPAPDDMESMDPEIAAAVSGALDEVRAGPADAARWRRLALVYDGNDLHDLARRCYERAVELVPSDKRSWYDLALMRAEVGDIAGAMSAVQRVIAIDPFYAPAHWRLGFWLLEEGDAAGAEAAFEESRRIDPEDSAAWIGLARARLHREADEEAAAVLRELIDRDLGNAACAQQLLARALRRLGRMDEAEAAAIAGAGSPFVTSDPWRKEVRAGRAGLTAEIRRASSLVADGRAAEGVALMEDLRRRYPDEVSIATAFGTTLRKAGRLDESVGALETAVAMRETYYPAHLELARTLAAAARGGERGRQLEDRALAHLDRAIELNETLAGAHGLRGELLFARGDVAGAVRSFEQAARSEPANTAWLYRAAVGQCQLGEWDAAVEALLVVTARDPDSVAALHLLGVAQSSLGRLDEAEKTLNRAALLAPDDPAVQAALRQIGRRRGGP